MTGWSTRNLIEKGLKYIALAILHRKILFEGQRWWLALLNTLSHLPESSQLGPSNFHPVLASLIIFTCLYFDLLVNPADNTSQNPRMKYSEKVWNVFEVNIRYARATSMFLNVFMSMRSFWPLFLLTLNRLHTLLQSFHF